MQCPHCYLITDETGQKLQCSGQCKSLKKPVTYYKLSAYLANIFIFGLIALLFSCQTPKESPIEFVMSKFDSLPTQYEEKLIWMDEERRLQYYQRFTDKKVISIELGPVGPFKP